MPIQTRCKTCQTLYRLADNLAGKRIRCKKCNEVLRVPEATRSQEVDEAEDVPAPLKKAHKKSADVPQKTKKFKASSPGTPNDVRRAAALLVFVGFLECLAFYMLSRLPDELRDAGKLLTPWGEQLLLMTKALVGGIALLSIGAAVLLICRIGAGRLLAFLVAFILLLSLVPVIGMMLIQDQWDSAMNWLTVIMNSVLGLSILFFADTKNVRAYLAGESDSSSPSPEAADEPEADEHGNEDEAPRRQDRK